MLVQDTVRTSIGLVQKLTKGETEAQQVKTFPRMVLQGNIRQAVRFVTERGQGGELAADDMIPTKDGTESTVEEILISEYPDAIFPEVGVLEEYNVIPEMVTLDVTEETVAKVAAKLSGAADPGGVDAMGLQQWFLKYGISSNLLREAVAAFTR